MTENYFIATKSGKFINRNFPTGNNILDFNNKDIITFFDVNLNKELGKIENIDLCILENKDLMRVRTMIETLIKKIINKTFSNTNYEKTFLYEIFEKKLINYNYFLNASFFSSYEKEMKSEDKINYPKYLLEENKEIINKTTFYQEKERVKLFNNILKKIYYKKELNIYYYDDNLSDFSFFIWNLNCLISFNLIFDFLECFNPEQKNDEIKKIKGNSEEKIASFLNKPVITITALFFIDVLYNYVDYRKISENKLLGSCKLEGFSGSGSSINKNINPEKERKYKNSIFDIVDIISSLILFEKESLYITNDKGINLFLNWYKIDFSKLEITSNVENSIIKYINKSQLFEVQLQEKKFTKISENHKLINELENISENKLILKKLISYYSFTKIFNEDCFELFYENGYCKNFEEMPSGDISLVNQIRLFNKGLTVISRQNPNQLIIDIFTRNLLNNYIGFLNKILAEKLIKYQENYFI